jgi:hypothetical protein
LADTLRIGDVVSLATRTEAPVRPVDHRIADRAAASGGTRWRIRARESRPGDGWTPEPNVVELPPRREAMPDAACPDAGRSDEELGEEAVATMTASEEQSDRLEADTSEEVGGAFVRTPGRKEYARDSDKSNPRSATREPFPNVPPHVPLEVLCIRPGHWEDLAPRRAERPSMCFLPFVDGFICIACPRRDLRDGRAKNADVTRCDVGQMSTRRAEPCDPPDGGSNAITHPSKSITESRATSRSELCLVCGERTNREGHDAMKSNLNLVDPAGLNEEGGGRDGRSRSFEYPSSDRAASASLFVALALVLVACSSASDPSPGDSTGALSNSPTNKSSGGSDSSKTPAPASSGPVAVPTKAAKAPNTAQCAATANREDCSTCCEGANGESLKVNDDAFNQCACNAAKAQCPAECAKGFCDANGANGTAANPIGASSNDDPCMSCMPNLDGCDGQAKKACDADPTCSAAEKCYVDAKCDSKPPGPDEGTAEASSSSGK